MANTNAFKYSIIILIPIILIIIELILLILFIIKKINGKKAERIAELNGEKHVNKEYYLYYLKKLERLEGRVSKVKKLRKSWDNFYEIIKELFKNVLKINYEFTIEELITELRKKKSMKGFIRPLKRLDLKYSSSSSKEDIEELISEFCYILKGKIGRKKKKGKIKSEKNKGKNKNEKIKSKNKIKGKKRKIKNKSKKIKGKSKGKKRKIRKEEKKKKKI